VGGSEGSLSPSSLAGSGAVNRAIGGGIPIECSHATSRVNRVLACVDNRVGFECLRFLSGISTTRLVGVIVHPVKTALYWDETIAFCRERQLPCFEIGEARDQFEKIAALEPDFLVSIYFDYILDSRFLNLPRFEAVNLHPGYLPYNRGFYYYVWAVLDGTPAGVSIHAMRPAVDAGEIISQARVFIEPADTGDIIYKKHEEEAIRLFQATWPAIVCVKHRHFRQLHPGTRHRLRDAEQLVTIDPFEKLRVIDLIDRVRLLTGTSGSLCMIEINGRTYRLSIDLTDQEVDREAFAGHPGGTRMGIPKS